MNISLVLSIHTATYMKKKQHNNEENLVMVMVSICILLNTSMVISAYYMMYNDDIRKSFKFLSISDQLKLFSLHHRVQETLIFHLRKWYA